MAERPIIFSASMVQALQEGRKTQTRRRDTPGWDGFIGRFEKGEPCVLWVKENIWRDPLPGMSPYAADSPGYRGAMKTSLFMPRRLSRITLEVTAIRRQRLHEIDIEDAHAEGLAEASDAIDAYRSLWSRLNGSTSWPSNPDVLAFTFNILQKKL